MLHRLFTAFLAAFGLAGGISSACTVPVFRYALDHWPPDPYRLAAPAGWLEGNAGAGLRKLLDESGMKLELQPPAEAGTPARLLMPGDGPEVWSGVLDENAPALLVSPARNELARRILAGDSMVWVMVTSGDESADRKFEESFKERLEYLQSVAAIPEQDPTDPENKLGPGPGLRVGFSFMKVTREDPEEQVFLRMLAGTESSLLEKEGPFGAVVFGRGRVLGAWPAADLDEEGIDEVSLFLLGACSCRVKFQNPGWDLALALDWDEALLAAQMASENERGEPVPVRDPEPQPQPEVVRIEGGDDSDAVNTRREGKNPKAHAGAGPAISVLVALTGVLALYCVLAGKGSAKGS